MGYQKQSWLRLPTPQLHFEFAASKRPSLVVGSAESKDLALFHNCCGIGQFRC
ncbi:Uncharacterised protein [Vibrio cholerae]|nr:Uncharacterised protein [Vibrio cholerae]